MRDFRFGFNTFAIRSREDFVRQCRLAEGLGYDVALAADHLGRPAPFPMLTAAADATGLRVGTLVLNIAFWNPHLLAREAATVDLLTDGRLELGLGAGHMRWEFDTAGLEWTEAGARIERLERAVGDLRGLFAEPGYEQLRSALEHFGLPVTAGVQRRGFGGFGPPLLIGGMGDRVLRLAAREADIAGISGLFQIDGRPPGTFRVGTAAEADERMGFLRRHAGERAAGIECNVLVQLVAVTPDRRGYAESLVAEQMPYLSAEEALETPFLLIGTVDQIADQLRERRERYGFSYITVHGPFMEAFGPVIERLR